MKELTQKEKAALEAYKQAAGMRKAAALLGITMPQLSSRLHRAYRKLGVDNYVSSFNALARL